MNRILCKHLPNEEHFVCFQVLMITNEVARDTTCADFCIDIFSIFVGKNQGVGLVDHIVKVCCSVLPEINEQVFKVALLFCSPTNIK